MPGQNQPTTGTLSLCNFWISGAKSETDWGHTGLLKNSLYNIITNSYVVGTPIAHKDENSTPSVGSEMLMIQHGVC